MDDKRAGPGEFAALLRRFRDRAALSQEELAEAARLTAKAIGTLERGERRRPYPQTVRALADALELDADDRAAFTAAARESSRGQAPAPEPKAAPASDRKTAPAPIARPAGPLFGRDADRDEIVSLLRAGTARLLTLTGPGGVGKTTLALDVAAAVVADFDAGVAVVELAAVREPRFVLPAVARALGARQVAEGAVEGIARVIGTGRRLLVLDNVEHLLDAAPDVALLLAHCPGLVVLATSRAALRIRAEVERPLHPLALPRDDDPATVAASAAALVFLDRARAAGADVEVDGETAAAVAAICRRLAGLPLALELAAAHARLLPPRALLDRLDSAVSSPRSRDLPERQRTVRATLDWSHALLTHGEQLLLRRLSVFAGGFDLAAAEAVLDADVLEPLAGLVEQSLVQVDGHRYRLLEPVRGYAAARLAEAGDGGEVEQRATTYYGRLASAARDGLRGAEQARWLDRLGDEHANLSVTAARLVAEEDFGRAARLWADTWLYWALRGSAVEALEWVARVPADRLDATGRAALAVAAAGLRYASGDPAGMATAAAEGVQAARAAGDSTLLAEALVLAGSAAVAGGRGGETELDEAYRVAVASGDRWAAIHAGVAQAQRLLRAGELESGAGRLREAEAAARALGSPFTLATVLNGLASAALLVGDDDGALRRLGEAVSLAAGIGTTWTLAYALPALAARAARCDEPLLAVELAAAGAAAASVTVAYPPDSEAGRTWLPAVRERLGERQFGQAWDRGRTLRPTDLPELVARITPPGRS